MARYRRRGSMHWLWQQRDGSGRFSSSRRSGPSLESDPEWFQQMPWWKKLLIIISCVAFAIILYIWLPGLLLFLGIIGLIGTFCR